MTNLDLNQLREIAEAATPWPWESSMVRVEPDADNALRGAGVIRDGNGSIVLMVANGPEILVSDATHIAAFDPPTVLALIDEIELLRETLATVRSITVGTPECNKYDNESPVTCGWKFDLQRIKEVVK